MISMSHHLPTAGNLNLRLSLLKNIWATLPTPRLAGIRSFTTGLGDAIVVTAGHCAYFAAKKPITGDNSIYTTRELQTGLLLASTAF